MDFDEAANLGPSWAKSVSELIAAEEPAKALEAAKDAFVRSLRAGDVKGKVLALHALAKVHLSKFEINDACELAERALAELLQVPDDALEAAVLHTVAKANKDLCRFDDALELADEALRKYQGAGSKVGEAALLNTMARIHLSRGRRQDCIKAAKQSLAVFRACQERHGECEALHTLVRANMAMGKHEEALRLANQMLGIYEGGPEVDKHGVALLVVADVRAAMEEHDEAVEVATKAVELFDGGDKRLQANATRRLADACFAKGWHADGWMYAKEALEMFRGEGHRRGEAGMLCDIAKAHFSAGSLQEGVFIADEGAKLCREAGFKQLLADTLLAAARGRLDVEASGTAQEQHLNWKARQGGKEALAIYQDIGDLRGQMRAHNTLAMAFMSYGNVLEGRAKAKRAVELSQVLGDKTAEGTNLLLVAQSRFHDNVDEARRLASIASRLIREGGDSKTIKEAQPVVDAIRVDLDERKPDRKGGAASLAETMASKMDLTLDFDMMKTRAVYFWGFTSRSTR